MACHLGQTPLGCWVHGSDLGHVHAQLTKDVSAQGPAHCNIAADSRSISRLRCVPCMHGYHDLAERRRHACASCRQVEKLPSSAVKDEAGSSKSCPGRPVQLFGLGAQGGATARNCWAFQTGAGSAGSRPMSLTSFLQGCFRNEAGAFVLALGAGVAADDPCCLGCSTISWNFESVLHGSNPDGGRLLGSTK
jgi:hypothetical protein